MPMVYSVLSGLLIGDGALRMDTGDGEDVRFGDGIFMYEFVDDAAVLPGLTDPTYPNELPFMLLLFCCCCC